LGGRFCHGIGGRHSKGHLLTKDKVAAKEFGAIDYWRNNKLPDFCDGSFKIWICELHDER